MAPRAQLLDDGVRDARALVRGDRDPHARSVERVVFSERRGAEHLYIDYLMR